jgi:S1-C subfamily serine protease
MTVRDQGDLQAALTNRFKPGAQGGLQINHDGNKQTVPVTLAERPPPEQRRVGDPRCIGPPAPPAG